MGKGDSRTRRGKIFKGSYGNSRPKGPHLSKAAKAAIPSAKKGSASKTAAKKKS